jgi:predicted amidohydrolase
MRVAAATWNLRPAKSDSDYFGHFYDLVEAAHEEGAELVVMPEKHCLELLQIVPDLETRNVGRYLAQYAQPIEDWIRRIADSSGLIIVGGSHFRGGDDRLVLATAIGIPGHPVQIQERNTITADEAWMFVLEGAGLARLPRGLGVLQAHDARFPDACVELSSAGLKILCVPTFASTAHRFTQSRISCLARAAEHQVFVVQATLAGSIGFAPARHCFGTSAIICPPFKPWPADGLLRESTSGQDELIFADLDLGLIDELRADPESHPSWNAIEGVWELNDAQFPEGGHDAIRGNDSGQLN